MKNHFFKTFEFEFETSRLLWYAPYGGSDYAEVATTTERIRDGNYESWYTEWSTTTASLENRMALCKSNPTKARGYLRSSRYYQASEFFLDPTDSRKRIVYLKSVELFYKALDLLKRNYQINTIKYKSSACRSVIFYTDLQPKGTLYVCGGFDVLLEELYFTNVIPSLENGYNVVIYEGPGQSNVIRDFNLPFEADWNHIARCVVNYYVEQQLTPLPSVGVGLSLGGLLIARAASLDNTLFDRIVLYNYFPSVLDSFKYSIPKFLHSQLRKPLSPFAEAIGSLYIRHNKFLNWQVEHAKWTFGADSLNSLIQIFDLFDEAIALTSLHTDTLMFLAENENYYDYEMGISFYETIPAKRKKLVRFNKTDYSSDLHCQSGCAYESQEHIFEWLKTL